MAEIERDVPFYDQSGGGVTFTGGEPMCQTEFLKEALIACKEQHIHTAVDTSGYTSWENLYSILPLVDLFLYDLKLMDENQAYQVHLGLQQADLKQSAETLQRREHTSLSVSHSSQGSTMMMKTLICVEHSWQNCPRLMELR